MHQKIKLGFFSFSAFNTSAEHKQYGVWHRYDHMPEVLALPGYAHGQRYVCPPAYAKARSTNDASLAPSQYLTIYLISEPVDNAFAEMLRRGSELRAIPSRMIPPTVRVLQGAFLLVKAYASPRVLVSPDSIPYRPHRGLLVSVSQVLDAERQDAVAEWYDRTHIPDMMTVPGVAGAYWYMSTFLGKDHPFQAPRNYHIKVYYLDGEPLETLAEIRKRSAEWRKAGRYMDLAGINKYLFTSPFHTITNDKFDWFD